METFRFSDVSLDGSGSSDSDGNISFHNWYLNGERSKDIFSGTVVNDSISELNDFFIETIEKKNSHPVGKGTYRSLKGPIRRSGTVV